MRIAHLSDPHFGTEIPEVIAALKTAMREMRPDMIVVSGDITQRARAAQFDAAADFIGSLPPVPKLLVPGNHDLPLFNLPLRLLLPDHGYRRAFGAPEQERHAGGVTVAGFDATLRLRHTRGSLQPAHVLQRLRSAAAASSPRIVVVHQPLHTFLEQDRDECLIGAPAIAGTLARCGVDLVLSGHVHMPLLADTRAAFPELTRHFVLSGAGTAVSSRTRSAAPNSFNLITVERDKPFIRIDRCDYLGESFAARETAAFAREEDGWRQSPAGAR